MRTQRLIRALLTIAALIAPLTSTASAQAKPGKYFEDSTDLGFKIKTPKDWEFVPSQPGENNLMGTYVPKNRYVQIGGGNIMWPKCWIVKFDRRKGPDGKAPRGAKNLMAWMKTTDGLGSAMRKVSEKQVKVAKMQCDQFIYEGKSPQTNAGPGGLPTYAFATIYPLDPDYSVALVFSTPGAKKRWSKWKSGVTSMAKSLKKIEVERPEVSDSPAIGSGSMRARKRARLEKEVQTTPGWILRETPNYFIISNYDDKKFMEELEKRLEGIRSVYEVDYPIEKALIARKAKEEREAKEKEDREKAGFGIPDDGEKEEGDEPRSAASRADPMEQSRTSVVRVCATKAMYHSYGGPPSSAGYWNWVDEELVVYAGGTNGTRDTWITLNHEAFHQYIFYFYGNISPHSWYNEGTGDYYSGYQLNRRGKFELERNEWRLRTIQGAVRTGDFAPLKELVRWTQQEYYGSNNLGLGGGANYAQGWSFVYFLRTGEKGKARGWQDSWNGILDLYLDTLALTGDLDQAVEKAYAGVDWEAMEKSWKSYTSK
jgi:hypothetical protein